MATEDHKSNGSGTANNENGSPATTAIPDYLISPNAIFKDEGVQWRYGKPPDYSKTRKVWEEGKSKNHAAGSLEEMVENLVKNWEVEASFKPRLSDWRTINHEKYSFAMGGGPPQSAEHMIKVGTYNGIIAPNEYYSPENSDFASSHKTFKRMMPTFAWEVLEVYSGPPKVSFRWRHWGYMKNDYVGFNDKGQKVTAKAHGGTIDIEGVIVAEVDDKLRLCALQTWMDPLEMFRQIAPQGVVNKEDMNRNVDMEAALDSAPAHDGKTIAEEHNGTNGTHQHDTAPQEVIPKHVSQDTRESADAFVPHQGANTDRTTEEPPPQQYERTVSNVADSEPQSEGPNAVSAEMTNDSDAAAAQAIIDAAATNRMSMEIESPTSNFHDALERLPTGQELPSAFQPEPEPSALQTLPPSIYTSPVTGNKEPAAVPPNAQDSPLADTSQDTKTYDESRATNTFDAIDKHLESSADVVHPQPKDVEEKVEPAAGEAVVASAESEETRRTYEEMSRISRGECPFLMNRE